LVTLGFLEALGNIVDLMRNANVITAITSCVLILFLSASRFRKMPQPPIPSRE
jgi:hypothetical protein